MLDRAVHLRLLNQRNDPETGLHYNLHRYYDPACGAFISPDPLGLAGGSDPYAYGPSVYSHSDPSTEACLITSVDGGQTWSEPRIFTGGNLTSQNLTLLPDGTGLVT